MISNPSPSTRTDLNRCTSDDVDNGRAGEATPGCPERGQESKLPNEAVLGQEQAHGRLETCLDNARSVFSSQICLFFALTFVIFARRVEDVGLVTQKLLRALHGHL